MHTRSVCIALVAGLSISSAALAQQDPPRGPGGPGGGGGRGNFVERMMERDADGDGKVSKAEVEGTFFERFFDNADANKDGFVTREEIENAPPPQRGPGGGAGNGGNAGDAPSFHESMESAGAAFRLLQRADFNAEDQTRTYAAIDNLQRALINAKTQLGSAPLANAAKEKYNGDEAAIRLAIRTSLVETIEASIVMEKALLAGDNAKASEQVAVLRRLQNVSHDTFEPKRGERRGSQALPVAPEQIKLAMMHYFVHVGRQIESEATVIARANEE
ncbi:MAG: EF-hand domain-containing protein [Phycisphaeraceae bacterium]|nr:EF-hand domain-containing protein [Phycisphaerales bacterium]MCB9860888.1 EF-hand domain-containing protein [Phycisphaeraceae bacterium]